MKQQIDISNESLTPKIGKSNIPIKTKKKKAKNPDIERRLSDAAKGKGANIVFGFDNGATRNACMHCSV